MNEQTLPSLTVAFDTRTGSTTWSSASAIAATATAVAAVTYQTSQPGPMQVHPHDVHEPVPMIEALPIAGAFAVVVGAQRVRERFQWLNALGDDAGESGDEQRPMQLPSPIQPSDT